MYPVAAKRHLMMVSLLVQPAVRVVKAVMPMAPERLVAWGSAEQLWRMAVRAVPGVPPLLQAGPVPTAVRRHLLVSGLAWGALTQIAMPMAAMAALQVQSGQVLA